VSHDSNEAPDSLIGTVLDGRYRIVRRVAEGGMGVVYEAEQAALHRKVAIKVLHAYLANDPEIETRFRREAMAITAVAHPNVVEVYDLGVMPDGRHYLVLEFLEGRDLASALRAEGPMPVGAVARVISAVAAGVFAAHEKQIIHRDLKPENVFLLDESPQHERVKVVDFGVARFADAHGVDSKTRTGTTVGTPYYMSPEQAQGRKDIDVRADVYALGVMGFRMLTGHHPFDDDSYPMLIVKICTELPPRVSVWRSDVPEELVHLLDAMMAKLPPSRPSSMREVIDALKPFLAQDNAPRLTGAPAPLRALPMVFDTSAQQAVPFERTQAASSFTPRDRASSENRLQPREDMSDEDKDMANSLVGAKGNPTLRWIALGMGVVTLGGIALAIANRDPEVASETEEPPSEALPTPTPPRTRPMTGGMPEDGWNFINPRPRVMPQWNAVSTVGPGLVAMVGAGGSAARMLNGSLVTWRTGTDRTLYSVAWSGSNEAVAVGEAGVIVRLDPRAPQLIASTSNLTLRAVASLSATEQIAVGDDGALMRIQGDRASAIEANTHADLLAIHVSEGEATIVGEAGLVLHVSEGRVVSQEQASRQTLRAITRCHRAYYAAGDEGTILRRSNAGAWRPVVLQPATTDTFMALSCEGRRVVAVGANGDVRLVSGLRSVKLETDFPGVFTGVSGAEGEATWLVGTSGRLATVEGDHIETRVTGPIASLRDISDVGGALVAVGDWGKLIREHEHGLVFDQAPTESGLGALAHLGDGGLVAVGDGGTMLRILFEHAVLLPSPTESALRGVVTFENSILAVGVGGTIVRGTPDALTATVMPNAPNFAAIAGTPSDALAVGDQGFVAHFSDAGAVQVPCDVHASLRAVVRVGEVHWAAGENGSIVRIENGACVLEHHYETSGPVLNGIGRGPDGHLIAVGDMGSALVRRDDGTWTTLDLDVGNVSLRAIRTIDRWVFVVGAGGVILRRIRTDGE
jgi:serine/threonine-protein kinase